MATTSQVIEQGLSLPRKSRKLVVRRLFESLEQGRRLPPSLEEMLRRVDEINLGTVATFSREEVARDRAKLRAAASKRPQSK